MGFFLEKEFTMFTLVRRSQTKETRVVEKTTIAELRKSSVNKEFFKQ